MSNVADRKLWRDMSDQIAQVHGAMFGEGNTSGVLSTVLEVKETLAVHIDGGRAEARKIAAITALVVQVGTLIMGVVIFLYTGIPFVNK